MASIYRNIPQLKVQLIDTQIMVCRWGRATGKTKIGGYWTVNRAMRMPRSGNAIAGATYTHLMTKLAPGIVREWEELGWKEGIHFWLGKFPPKEYRIPKGLQPMLSPKHTVFWYNGSYTQFLSTERGLNNALSADSIYFDEARFLPHEKVREIQLTLRGNNGHFGHLSCHTSSLLTSDAPRSARSQWFNDYERQMNGDMIDTIFEASICLNNLKLELTQAKSERKRISLRAKINYYEGWLNEARKGQLYFSRASTLDNVHAIGIQTIENFKKMLTPSDFRISVLNKDSAAPPSSFYPLLNEEVHGFHSEDSAHISALDFYWDGMEKNCLWKSRKHYDPGTPLDIALDYNNAINSLVVGQGDQREYRMLNAFYVLGENREFLPDVVKKFTAFYRPHREKTVNYYYDNTAVSSDATGRISFAEEVCKELSKEGWQVIRHRINQASRHEHRFEFWLKLLGETDSRLPKFRYDLDDCRQWQISAENAEAKPTEGGRFRKDKSTETRKDKDGNYLVRPEDSTHLSEAADTLIDGKFGRSLIGSADFVE